MNRAGSLGVLTFLVVLLAGFHLTDREYVLALGARSPQERPEQPEEGGVQDDAPPPKDAEKAPQEDAPPLLFKGMEFNPGVSIGKAVSQDCTTRCHIEYPFKMKGAFRHDIHAPEMGFHCNLCHLDKPLPHPLHGRLAVIGKGCKECHHDNKRFPSCLTCHKPVNRQFPFRELTFDHQLHTTGPNAPSCSECHADPVNRKAVEEALSCMGCHHAAQRALDCVACHQDATTSKTSEIHIGFDHGLHATSGYMKEKCRSCHRVEPELKAPAKLPCMECHHPADPGSGPGCGHCHDNLLDREADLSAAVFHETHGKAGYGCTDCHDAGPLRSPTVGMNCAGCHHDSQQGCRTCHRDKLHFVAYFDGNASSVNLVPFSHASHETQDNCSLCHLPGPELRAGFETVGCADCHHHGGAPLECADCHREIMEIRAGRLPSGMEGAPDPMFGIVSCEDCHRFDPAAHHSVTDGTNSCLDCHPEEYGELLTDWREVLGRALKAGGTETDQGAARRTVARGLHNFHLALKAYQARK